MAQWGFPSQLKLSSTQTFQENGGEKDPKASWSFPVSCFYSVSQCVCPRKERWRSLLKVCGVGQRLASRLKHILLTGTHHDIITMTSAYVPFWWSTIVFVRRQPCTHTHIQNRTFFLMKGISHTLTHRLLQTLATIQKTHKSPSSLRAFWTLQVICLTAIKCWKGTRGVFMKAIIACKDLVCLR